jgi:hypothetical protein
VTGLSCNPARSRGGGFSNRAPLARPTRRSAGCRIAAGFAQMRWSPPWSAQAQVSPQALLRRRMSWRIPVEWRSSSRMPARRIPLGKLHQRADQKSAACSPSMSPAPPRVREKTHRANKLTRAAVGSARRRSVSARAPELAMLSWSSIFQRHRERTGERNESTDAGRGEAEIGTSWSSAAQPCLGQPQHRAPALPPRGDTSPISHALA